jgi:RecA-family ATPase
MTPYEQAARYVAKVPGAISGQGGHNATFTLASTLTNGFALSEGEALTLLADWNRTCQPPWSDHDLRHKVQSAMSTPHDKPRGHKLRAGRTDDTPFTHRIIKLVQPIEETVPQFKRVKYELKDTELPEEIKDGARLLIKTLFREGEGVRIAQARMNEDGREIPDGGGLSLSREQWLAKLDNVGGDPNKIFSSSDRTGIYIALNPYRPGCTKDADVTDLRHALVEFDEGLTPEEQLSLYQQMNLPCAATIYSGGKSIHAWVKIDAQSRAEYDERVRILYAHFKASGYKLDEKNKNPGRFSRLPFCVRFKRRQQLISLHTGAESWAAWQEEVQGDDLGERLTVDELGQVNLEDKSDVLLGDDWLNKGASCLLSGPSGVGKSAIAMQWAVHFALGLPVWGIKPTRPLRSVIICAENDTRDNHRMLFSILARLGIDQEFTPHEWELVRANVIIRINYVDSGPKFVAVAKRIADKDRPDLMWLDPAAAFVGDDISKQTVVAQFFRNGLHPVAKHHGFAWVIMNHFTKPPGDKSARQGWTSSDHQYRGAGSYDLTGWARAGVVLSEVQDGLFSLRFAKRGKQSGACHPSGEPSSVLWLRHAQQGIYWEQVDPPQEGEEQGQQEGEAKQDKPKELTIVEVVENLARNGDLKPFFAACPAEGRSGNKTAAALKEWLLSQDSPLTKERRKKGIGDTKAKECVAALLAEGFFHLNNGLHTPAKL